MNDLVFARRAFEARHAKIFRGAGIAAAAHGSRLTDFLFLFFFFFFNTGADTDRRSSISELGKGSQHKSQTKAQLESDVILDSGPQVDARNISL
jgi:hypothetical protein